MQSLANSSGCTPRDGRSTSSWAIVTRFAFRANLSREGAGSEAAGSRGPSRHLLLESVCPSLPKSFAQCDSLGDRSKPFWLSERFGGCVAA